MHLSIQSSALTFFWGSILTHLVWNNKENIFEKTKSCTNDAVSYLWGKTKKIFKSSKVKSIDQKCSGENVQEDHQQHQNQPSDDEKDKKKKERPASKPKKVQAKTKKYRNMRKYAKNYEEWFLRKVQIRKIEANTTEAYRTSSKEMEQWREEGQITLKKEQTQLQTAEDFEKFIEEQVEFEDEDEMKHLLPYDPFLSENEQDEL